MAVRATSVEDAASKKIPGWDGLWCGDVWKAVVDLRSQKGLNAFVLDCDMGLGIVYRTSEAESSNAISREKIKGMTYEDLAQKRTELLGLKDPAHFENFLRELSTRRQDQTVAAVGVL